MLARGLALLVLVSLALAIGAGPARAQDRAAVAEALFNQGREAMRAEDYATACAKFQESERIDPQVGTRLNLGTCSEKLGKLATAWGFYQGVRDELPAGDDRRPIVEERIAAIRDRVPHLTLTLASGAPTDTVVRLGQTEVRGGGFGAPLPVDPGEVTLVVSAPGRAENEVSVTIAVAESKSIEVAPGAPLPEQAEPLPPTGPTSMPGGDGSGGDTADTGGNAQAVAGWVLTGVGIAAILAGVGTGIGGLMKKKVGDDPAHCSDVTMTCDQEGHDANKKARVLLTTTTIAWVAGGVLAGVGVTLVLTSGDGDSQTALSTVAYPGGGGLRFEQRF